MLCHYVYIRFIREGMMSKEGPIDSNKLQHAISRVMLFLSRESLLNIFFTSKNHHHKEEKERPN